MTMRATINQKLLVKEKPEDVLFLFSSRMQCKYMMAYSDVRKAPSALARQLKRQGVRVEGDGE